jgi:hypothetical protein
VLARVVSFEVWPVKVKSMERPCQGTVAELAESFLHFRFNASGALIKDRILSGKARDAIDMLVSIVEIGIAGMAETLMPQQSFSGRMQFVQSKLLENKIGILSKIDRAIMMIIFGERINKGINVASIGVIAFGLAVPVFTTGPLGMAVPIFPFPNLDTKAFLSNSRLFVEGLSWLDKYVLMVMASAPGSKNPFLVES